MIRCESEAAFYRTRCRAAAARSGPRFFSEQERACPLGIGENLLGWRSIGGGGIVAVRAASKIQVEQEASLNQKDIR